MRKISYTKQFKKDYKKILKSQYSVILDKELLHVINTLANDKILSYKYKNHALTGNWKGFKDCHIKPDLVLLYSKSTKNTLELIRLGSHSQLGL